jgi:hypothetical protein
VADSARRRHSAAFLGKSPACAYSETGEQSCSFSPGVRWSAQTRFRRAPLPQAEVYTADELLALCKRLRETMELRELP